MTRSVLTAVLFFAVILARSASAANDAKSAPAYVVVVDYTTDAANFDALKGLVDGVGKASIAEPGCRRFDVVQPAAVPTHLILYEIFDDAAAFQAHAASPYFKQFAADTAKINATRTAMPGTMLLSLQKP